MDAKPCPMGQTPHRGPQIRRLPIILASMGQIYYKVAMVNYMLRHNSAKLRDRYVAPLSIEEAVEKQEIMEKELFGKPVIGEVLL